MTRVIEAMAKHLPPSASTLRLLDLNGASAPVLTRLRPDIAVTVGQPPPGEIYDAVVAFDAELSDELLAAALAALRPGGRLIVALVDGAADAGHVRRLEALGYVRIYVAGLNPSGVLIRGEQRHATADTLARIQSVASSDAPLLRGNAENTAAANRMGSDAPLHPPNDPNAAISSNPPFRGRFVHLLIRQTPNKPVWALTPDDKIEWQAVAVAGDDAPTLLAFSSLPNAVAFMQPAVIAGRVGGVNKVAKFKRKVAAGWRMLVNPTLDELGDRSVALVAIDPALAEAPDE